MPKAKDKIVAKYLDVVETANKEKRKNSASFVEKSFFKDFKY